MNPAPEPSPTALQVTVVNGNLRFVPQPLLLGHYRSAALAGTEHVMDELIGGAMATALALGHYPEQPRSYEVFVNTRAARDNPLQLPRPKAVIVVGLGEEGTLKPVDLVRTVSAGVVAWARRLAESTEPDPRPLEIAATLIGSGGTGITAAQSASLVVEGVLAANERLSTSAWPRVHRLHLVELYLDRATEAWRTLRAQSAAGPAGFTLDEVIATGGGALRRPIDGGYRGARYDLITALSDEGRGGVSYTVDTRRARTEVHAHAMQKPLLRDLVAKASGAANQDGIGRTLFRLLVPVELEPFLAGTTDAVIELDGGTSGIPWEMLDIRTEGAAPARPWALGTRLLRKLRIKTHRTRVQDSTPSDRVLIIGEPACDPARYDRLPGARAEAEAVTRCLLAAGLDRDDVMGLFSRDPADLGARAGRVINTLLSDDWRIVHISGHGEAPREDGPAEEPRGVVLSDGIFLGAQEIRSMRVVPELVFVNCCHLGARAPGDLLEEGGYDRPRFAATVAEALIEVGVRCVVAAGWAVEDRAAQAFATTFYRQLADGSRFIDAVAAAREAAYAVGGNTWAAYQCYGDPDWTFRVKPAGTVAEPAPPEQAFANVASPTALVLALETIAVNSAFDEDEKGRLRANVEHLEERFADRWGGRGAVAEAFGRAWAEADRARAIAWYARALEANDGGASLWAVEQLGNLRVRVAWEGVSPWNASAGAPPSQDRLDAARAEIQAALGLLERLADAVQSTSERESLCGSAWKRLALVEAIAERPQAEEQAIARMKERYARAEELARGSGDAPLFYPALNRMAAELVADAAAPGWPGFDAARVEEVRASLQAAAASDPDFWSVAGLIELRLYEAVARGGLAGARASLEKDFADLQKRVASEWLWASADDQLEFVLSRYRNRASGPEREAADALLALLRGYAGRPLS
ncbi:MAG TPA: CHAT domain-containing protein [Longimicrobium sp.]|nr:CHAT domain-containing protein [Longimicrobium sp.]